MNSFPSSINTIQSDMPDNCSFHKLPSTTWHFLSHITSTGVPVGLFTKSRIISTSVVFPVALSPWIIVRFLRSSNSYFKRFVDTITLCFPFIVSSCHQTNSPAIDTSSSMVCTISFVLRIRMSNGSTSNFIK